MPPLLLLLPLLPALALSLPAAKKQNVLLLICDDLRTQLKVYGHADYMHTPHIDIPRQSMGAAPLRPRPRPAV